MNDNNKWILHKADAHKLLSFPHNIDPDMDLMRMPAKELQQS